MIDLINLPVRVGTDSKWTSFWGQDRCDSYSRCGPNGVCNIQNLKLCECLAGYRPRSNTSWQSRDYSQGCQRKEKLKCEDGENGFLPLTNLKIPNTMINSTIHKNISLKACEIRCSTDCACVAYAPIYLRQAKNYNLKGCILWFGDLIDIKQLGEDGQDIYLRLPISEIPSTTRKKSTRKNIIIATTIIGSFVLLLFGILIFIRKKMKKKYIQGFQNHGNDKEKWKDLDITIFDLSIMSKVTNNFSNHCKIGEGGFASVYKVFICLFVLLQKCTDGIPPSEVSSINLDKYINGINFSGYPDKWSRNSSEKAFRYF